MLQLLEVQIAKQQYLFPEISVMDCIYAEAHQFTQVGPIGNLTRTVICLTMPDQGLKTKIKKKLRKSSYVAQLYSG